MLASFLKLLENCERVSLVAMIIAEGKSEAIWVVYTFISDFHVDFKKPVGIIADGIRKPGWSSLAALQVPVAVVN